MPRGIAVARGIRTGGAIATARNIAVNRPNYLLYDAFLTPRAAGAINGTTSESPFLTGGGIPRVTVDTGSRLSIVSTVLTFATGGGSGDPAIWYSQLTRTLGRVLLVRLALPNTSSNKAGPGWDTNQSGAPIDALLFTTSGNLQAFQNSVSIRVGDWAAATYTGCIIQRSTGYHYLIKGGAFTHWTYLWTSAVVSSNMFPVFGSHTSGGAFSGYNIRIPVTLYIPVAIVYDTFTRANGALGSTETTDPDSQIIAAKVWTDQIGTWTVASNKAQASALVGGIAIATYDGGYVDTMHTARLTRSAGTVGGVVRYVDVSNFVEFYHDGTNFKVDKIVAASRTNVLTAVVSHVANAEGRVIIDGTKIRGYYNNVAIGVEGTIADAALQTSTLVGISTTNTGNTLDDVTTRARGNSVNAYPTLDLY